MITAPPGPSMRASRRASSALEERRRTASPWPYRRRLWIAACLATALHAAFYFLKPSEDFVAAQLDLGDEVPWMETELVAGEEPPAEAVPEPPEPEPVPVEQPPPPPEPPEPEPIPEPEPEPEEMISPTPEPPKPTPAPRPPPKPKPAVVKSAPKASPTTATGTPGAAPGGAPGGRGAGSSRPSVTWKVSPPKPQESELGGIRRTVLVALTVDASGRPTDLSIASSSGLPRLDRAALEAVRRWRFKPATRNGVPVSAAATAPIVYDPPRR